MKNLYTLLLIVIAISFTSCSSDDDDIAKNFFSDDLQITETNVDNLDSQNF